jgi:hypothetical protein
MISDEDKNDFQYPENAGTRLENAIVLAPISRSLVLVGRHATDAAWNVTPAQVNAVIACWAHEWIAGPTQSTVEDALNARRRSSARRS